MVNYKKLWKYIESEIKNTKFRAHRSPDKYMCITGKDTAGTMSIWGKGKRIEMEAISYTEGHKKLDKLRRFRDLLIRTRERTIRQPDKIHILDNKGNIVGTFDTITNERIYKLDEVSGKLYVKDERKP